IPRGSSTRRGALSFSFARVVDGTAPIGRAGSISRGDLIDYINATVRTFADNAQDPDFKPRADFDRAVVKVSRDLPNLISTSANASLSQDIRIFVFGGEPIATSPSRAGEFQIIPATSNKEADLIFDEGHGSVYSARGDLIATGLHKADLNGVA